MHFLERNPLLLASKSPRRHELMEKLGIPFRVKAMETDESIDACPPEDTVMELAARKARAVAETEESPAFVLGVDTVVALDGEIFGKPRDEADAFRMLERLQGNAHQVYTGIHLIDLASGIFRGHVEMTRVEVDSIAEDEIKAYIATGEPMDKAGAYGIQGEGGKLVQGIRGSYENVMGLPVEDVLRALDAYTAWAHTQT